MLQEVLFDVVNVNAVELTAVFEWKEVGVLAHEIWQAD